MAGHLSYDEAGNRRRVSQLAERGVDVWGPERVYISPEVPLENIETGAILRNATLAGKDLRIGKGSRVGVSGHARLTSCQLGRDVEIGAGSYENATILDGAVIRGFAELRDGTLLEEQTVAAHNVAFKNTILTATVVTGSLINFCDLFMSGGISREDHSEVGSGAIHFNFDPRGDKWSSLLGDATGVLLRSAPIFIGGNSGMAGPLHVDFGAVVPAGTIARGNVPADVIHFGQPPKRIEGFDREIYAGLKRKFLATAKLAGNLWALDAWYRDVRLPYASGHEKPLYQAARGRIQSHIQERASRIEKLTGKLARSIEKSSTSGNADFTRFHDEHRLLIRDAAKIRALLASEPQTAAPPPELLRSCEAARPAKSHIEAITSMDEAAALAASEWLRGIAGIPADGLNTLFRVLSRQR